MNLRTITAACLLLWLCAQAFLAWDVRLEAVGESGIAKVRAERCGEYRE